MDYVGQVYEGGKKQPTGDCAVCDRPLQAGQPLPALPLPLNVHEAVVIDLKATYHRAAKMAYLD